MAVNNYAISLSFDPNVSVTYGTSSGLLTGTGTVTMTPAFGISSLSLDIMQLSGSTSHFASVTANKPFPSRFTNGGTFTFTTKYDNTYTHYEPVNETIVAMTSTSAPQLSAGASGTVLADSVWLGTPGTLAAKANYQGFNGKRAFAIAVDDEGTV